MKLTLVISIIDCPYSSLSMFILGIANREGRIPKRAKGLSSKRIIERKKLLSKRPVR